MAALKDTSSSLFVICTKSNSYFLINFLILTFGQYI